MGMDLGVAVAPDMDVQTGGFDDWDTDAAPDDFQGVLCDTHIFPERPASNYCGGGAPQKWGPAKESFDGGSGILAGLAVGYRLGSFRVEGEYFYRGTRYGSRAEPDFNGWKPSDTIDTTRQYLDGVEDAVDNLMSHNVFANVYYDYRTDSKFTPYVGGGLGLARVSVQYRTRWHRNPDGSQITAIQAAHLDNGSTQDARDYNNRLAGLLTSDEATMSDTLFGYQALVGVDYQVSEPFTIGLKFRYACSGNSRAGHPMRNSVGMTRWPGIHESP